MKKDLHPEYFEEAKVLRETGLALATLHVLAPLSPLMFRWTCWASRWHSLSAGKQHCLLP